MIFPYQVKFHHNLEIMPLVLSFNKPNNRATIYELSGIMDIRGPKQAPGQKIPMGPFL